jgi:cytochrome c-type biogenesis protein CcmH
VTCTVNSPNTTSGLSSYRNLVIGGLLVILTGLWLPAFAISELNQFEDQDKQALYLKLTRELRCLVCQNQNLADSNAELAKDLRQKAWIMVDEDYQYDDIVKFMVDRYGDFVIYRPPLKPITLVLWIAPFFLAICLLLFLVFRRRTAIPNDAEAPSTEDLEKARTLIENSRTLP